MLCRGVELSLSYRRNEGAFAYDIPANAAFLHNEVTNLGIGIPIERRFPDGDGVVVTDTQKGYPIGSFIGQVTDGIFQTRADVDAHAAQQVLNQEI